eukprot:jgi/Picre1/33224/NNA_008549.t1
MCGILAALGVSGDAEVNRRDILRLSKLLRHRGPDASGVYQSPDGTALIAFERLSIIDPSDYGNQPFEIRTPKGDIVWALNCEIYNHEEIRSAKLASIDNPSKSDSSIVGYLYEKYGESNELWNSLDGIFAGVIWDGRDGTFVAARDAIGISSFYWGKGSDGSTWFASEMKSLQTRCEWVDTFPPGYVYRSKSETLERWHNPVWMDESYIGDQPANFDVIRQTFIDAVKKRLMSDAPLGVAVWWTGLFPRSICGSKTYQRND